jgi:hypothetical protein
MDGSGVEALFQRPGSDSDLFRLGHWSLDVPAATESPGPNAVPPTGAAPPDAWDSAQAVPDPGADDWLSIQLDEDGFYMFLGDVHGVPEEMSAVSEGWEELPSSIGIQKKWHF